MQVRPGIAQPKAMRAHVATPSANTSFCNDTQHYGIQYCGTQQYGTQQAAHSALGTEHGGTEHGTQDTCRGDVAGLLWNELPYAAARNLQQTNAQ